MKRAAAEIDIPAPTAPTDEQIKEIWESFGYRTRFAPHMLRLVRAVLSHTAQAAKAEGELN